jgi:hypothetical protein
MSSHTPELGLSNRSSYRELREPRLHGLGYRVVGKFGGLGDHHSLQCCMKELILVYSTIVSEYLIFANLLVKCYTVLRSHKSHSNSEQGTTKLGMIAAVHCFCCAVISTQG